MCVGLRQRAPSAKGRMRGSPGPAGTAVRMAGGCGARTDIVRLEAHLCAGAVAAAHGVRCRRHECWRAAVLAGRDLRMERCGYKGAGLCCSGTVCG